MNKLYEKLKRNSNTLFILSILIFAKLILAILFSSDYQNEMFIPFVDTFLNGSNPYQYYYDNNLLSSFPYPPIMLVVESIFATLIKVFEIKNLIFINFIFKFPIYIFDILLFCYLIKMGLEKKKVLVFYFLSPIVLYSSYMHGQLDVIPTALLIISIYYLTTWRIKNNLLISSFIFGISLCCKFHIIAALPIILLYILQKKNLKIAIIYLFIPLFMVVISILPFWGTGIIDALFFNKEQGSIFEVNLDYGIVKVILPILFVVLIYYKAFDIKFFNKSLLVSLIGFVFSIFLITVPSMPAWFVWVVPFLAIYLCNIETDANKTFLIYVMFNIFYLVYFIFLHKTDFVDLYFINTPLNMIKIDNESLKFLVFTLLTATLLVLMYEMYNYSIASNLLFRRGNKLFTIGIAGDSGTGKSKMKEKINDLFGLNNEVLYIEGDGDHKWERGDDNWNNYTALNPQANYLYKQARDIRKLRLGNNVDRVDYNHDNGKFTLSKTITPKKYIVLCGLHSLYLPQIRKELDLKIFMDTDDELRKYWKIERDAEKRGYSKQQIIKNINERYEDAKKYIYPQRDYADIVLTYFDKNLTDCMIDDYKVVMSLKAEVDIMYDLEVFINIFKKQGFNIKHEIGGNKQNLVFDGKEFTKYIDFEEIANLIVPQYGDLFTYTPKWRDGIEGLVQIFVLYMISIKMKGGVND